MAHCILYTNGTQFGEWTILEQGPSNKRGLTWLCQCSCGFKRLVDGVRLRNGTSTSCGCNSIKATKKALWKGHGEIGRNLWSAYERGATQRGFQFEITIEEGWDLFLKQERRCALSGIPLEMFSYANHYSYSAKGLKGGITGRRTNGTASLDRIDSSLGYVKGNVQWIHKDVNKMKQDLDEEWFCYLCDMITKNKLTSSP